MIAKTDFIKDNNNNVIEKGVKWQLRWSPLKSRKSRTGAAELREAEKRMDWRGQKLFSDMKHI